MRMQKTDPAAKPPALITDYLAMARPDHWIKQVFIVPGVVLAQLVHARAIADLLVPIVLGFLSAAAIASANYVLNEWLDARFDAFHPVKSKRPSVTRAVSPWVVGFGYLALSTTGLAIASRISTLFLVTSVVFLISGVLYNVAPIRTKDRVYLDVISEAINNPIRLTLGWAMVDSATLPPSSLLLAYWMGGGFLMAIKRFAEYRFVAGEQGEERLALYRRSFRSYSERSLLVSAFLYAQMAAFFLAVFLIKYRVEYLLSLPLFAALFGTYLRLGLKPSSRAQAPETLFREKSLVLVLVLLAIALTLLTMVDLPFLERLTTPHFIQIDLD